MRPRAFVLPILAFAPIAWLVSCASPAPESPRASTGAAPRETLLDGREVRLRNVRRLTFSGENAEAYWSSDATRLVFQAHRGADSCDQIFTMSVDGSDVRQVSTGGGRTTCAYFFPEGDRIVYASTRHLGPDCPPPPDLTRGYVWGLYDYDLYAANADGSDVVRLTQSPGYDAEATVSPDGRKIVFTSVRDGDLDIYTMNPDGSEVTRLTDRPGYDGGPFFSADGSMIIYRAYHPEDPEELADYRSLLADGKIRPGRLEIWVMNADGTGKRALTDNGAANFAPFFHPSGTHVIFASNMHDPGSRNFDLYWIGLDGSALERITWHDEFDSFPMFSPDGTTLVWASNRFHAEPGDTNIFVADWVEAVPSAP